jgi:small subunit ribosomal protein S2
LQSAATAAQGEFMPVSIPELSELLEAGVHFGHASARWHAKMAPYIFATRDKLHILDVEKTRTALETVLPVISQRIAAGNRFMLVGTKRQVAPLIRELGAELNVSYVDERWLGGTLTNSAQIQQSIKRMVRLEEALEDEVQMAKFTKKERTLMAAEVRRLHIKYAGLRNSAGKPDFMIVVDPNHERNAVREARSEGVELFGIMDTDSNPDSVDFVIPANDDGPKSLKLIMGLVKAAIAEGLANRPAETSAVAAPATKEEEQLDEIRPEEVKLSEDVVAVVEEVEAELTEVPEVTK